MTRKIVTGTYTFCINSNYYEGFVKYVKYKRCDVEKKDICEVGKEDSRNVGKKDSCNIGQEDNCNVGKENSCDKLSTSMTFSNNMHGKDICQEFKFLYKSLKEKSIVKTITGDIFSDNDCNFLNYWLNGRLRDNVKYGAIDVKDFYEKMKDNDVDFFSSNCKLDKHFYNIDTKILENMKLLYNLYDNAVKIISIISNKECTNEEQKLCIDHIKECDKKYKEAMDRCYNSNDDFYNALKYFKDSYKIITEPRFNESNACNSSEFYYFPEYDGVLEKKANAIKISSTLFVLSLALPLIYKYTPFGPFLRAKIRMVKDRWFNPDKNGDELLPLSTDIEDIISDNENYNIGYYS
ncbi:PIR Superfamily Protein [Plasmodium ovale curtisi]|uniref:PIR Superfamily Protein n=1 Tax=Plasmodium ovale curtisi TaxID=864141 RepID=A0A1A8XAT9_PLAOA|nr:PIR Superfamily Protein [Plasmodium ovale curtisi]